MTEDDVRRLIRETVARRLGISVPEGTAPGTSVPPLPDAAPWRTDISHAIYVTVVNAGDACVIEPGVACNHCNYCKSHGY
jgi:hypothetical protein